MKIDIKKLVLACNKNMRKVIQLDDLIECLLEYKIIDNKEFDELQDEFYNLLEECYNKDFLNNFIDICNSSNYIENL